jgi:hypothetical protein
MVIDSIARTLEASVMVTVFGGPGPVARLPDALGGDPTQWTTLMDNAFRGTNPKLALLHAKARFLMLPTTIVDFMRQDSPGLLRVQIREDVSLDAQGGGIQHEYPRRWAEILLPGLSEYLAKVGYDLGRVPVMTPVGYDMLGVCYHELTHALLWLQEYADADVQKLYNDGITAYLSAKAGDVDLSGDPAKAFSEAAGSYVEDRIGRWCKALKELDVLTRIPPADPTEVPAKLQKIELDYNQYNDVERAYGSVNDVAITSPTLSFELRDALDREVLEGLPLTKAFKDTPLVEIRNSLSPAH